MTAPLLKSVVPVARERIVDAVLGVSREPRRRRWLIPVVLGLGAHFALFLLAPRGIDSEQWALRTAQKVRSALAAEMRPIEPPPPPKPEPPPKETPEPQKSLVSARTPVRARAQPPAQAGKIIARASTSGEPVDFSSAFVVGSGETFAGGATSSAGTSIKPEPPPPPRPAPVRVAPPPELGPDLSTNLSLADDDWTCPWPHEAEDTEINEEAAVVRVAVDAQGKAESVSVVTDPGHGFGAAAAECARHAAYSPAHDREGHAIRTESMIRVRFTR